MKKSTIEKELILEIIFFYYLLVIKFIKTINFVFIVGVIPALFMIGCAVYAILNFIIFK